MSLETVNPFEIFEEKQGMYYYDSLTLNDRIKAWGSFATWINNLLGNMASDKSLVKRVFLDLIKSEYFCPLADKDIVLKIMKPAALRNVNECFIMVRLSENQRPLVWVCASGGSSKINRVRIGVATIPATSTTPPTTNYTVILEGQLAYQDTSLQAIMTKLYIHYGNGRTIHAWPRLMNQITIRPSGHSSAENQPMILI